jgi:hypothetical protein
MGRTGKGGQEVMKADYDSIEWAERSREIVRRDNWTCQACGKRSRQVQVHHKRYPPWDVPVWKSGDQDLVTLCRTCHRNLTVLKAEAKRELDEILAFENLEMAKRALRKVRTLRSNRDVMSPDQVQAEIDSIEWRRKVLAKELSLEGDWQGLTAEEIEHALADEENDISVYRTLLVHFDWLLEGLRAAKHALAEEAAAGRGPWAS